MMQKIYKLLSIRKIFMQFRLIVIGKSEAIAKELAEWAVEGEKIGESYEKKFELSGRTLSIKANPVWAEQKGAKPVGDGLLIACKEGSDLAMMEPVVEHYRKMPIKFIIYDGAADQTDYEVRWAAKGIPKKSASELAEKLITANNELVKLIATVFKSFDKDHSGYIELNEIQSLAKELGSDIPESEAVKIISELDTNHDGRISLEEFVEWWKTGQQGRTIKMSGLIEGWVKKNPLVQAAADAIAKITGAVESLKEEVFKINESSFAVHAPRVTEPGLLLEFGVMTKGGDLDSEFKLYSSAIALNPKEPFLGIAIGARNPATIKGNLEEMVGMGIAMAGGINKEAAQALSFIEPKFGQTSNKAFLCIAPSAQGSPMVEMGMQGIAPFLGLVTPDQLLRLSLAFATDLQKLITEDRPFYELLMDGVTCEAKARGNDKLTEKLLAMLKDPMLADKLPKKIKRGLRTFLESSQWFKCSKGELEFEFDKEFKDMIKNQIGGENPAAMPLKDLKMMFMGQAQAMVNSNPLIENLHKVIKEEMTGLEIFVYLPEIGGLKLRIDLPGLDHFLSLE